MIKAAQRPAPLKAGARLALIATAGPLLIDSLDAALEPYRAAGFEVVQRRPLGKQLGCPDYLAGDDATRLDELVWALTDPTIDAVLCVRGGYGSMRLLPALKDALEGRSLTPRPLIGFSDITALHAFCQTQLGWASLHAPLAFEFSPIPPATERSDDQQTSWRWLHKALTSSETSAAPCSPPLDAPSNVSGVLFGGNLAVLDAIYRSPYLPDLKGAVLVLEDVEEPAYRLDRMLTSLWLRGAAQEVHAVVLGRFTECPGFDSEDDALTHVMSLLKPWGVPIFTGLDMGHAHPQRALWFGRPCEVRAQEGLLLSDLDDA